MSTIFCAGQILDGTGRSCLKDYGICVCDGIVTDFDAAEKVIMRNRGSEIIDRENWLITPAFINAHDHGRPVSTFAFGMRDASLELWLQDFGKMPPLPAYESALLAGLTLADSGVGTVLHSHTAAGLAQLESEIVDTVRGYHDAGIRVAVCPSYMDQNKGIYANRDAFAAGLPEPLRRDFLGRLCDRPYSLSDYFGVIDRLLERLAPQLSAGTAALQLHPNGGQWCSDEALLGIRDYALAHGLRIHMHLLETKYQRRYAQDQWGCSFIRHYQEIGFLGPWVSFAHAVWLSDEDIALIAQSGAMVVNNPSSNLRLRSGTMPLKKLLRGGAVCALGMDGCAYDDDQDYLREMRTAMLNPGETGVNAGISPRDVMKMAVCGGAAVVGEGLAAGVIRSGAPADFVCFDLKKLGEFYMSPEVTPLELLVQRGTKHMIEAAYVGGVQVAGRSEPLKRRREEARARMRAAIEQAEAAHKPTDRSLLQAHIRAFYETWEERE